MKIEAIYFSGTLVALRGQHGVISQKIELFRFLIVTCRSIARERAGKHVSWDTKMRGVDSWKPARFCGINRRVHGYEWSTDIS
jgi:hypothetical protein